MCQLKCNEMRVFRFLVLSTLFVCVAGRAENPPQPRIDLNWVFITDQLTWTAPPKDPELPQYETALAKIVVFYPSGDYVDGVFWVDRYNKEPIFILPGNGFAIRRGHWSRNGNQIKVKSRSSYSEKVILTPTPESSSSEEMWVSEGIAEGRICARLKAPSGMYIPLAGLKNLSEFESIINASR